VSAKILETFKPMLQAQIQQGMVIEKNGFYQTSANYQNKNHRLTKCGFMLQE
jgi:hypothetical protein